MIAPGVEAWRPRSAGPFARAGAETVRREFDLQVEARRLVEVMSRRLRGETVAIRPDLPAGAPAAKSQAAAPLPAEATS